MASSYSTDLKLELMVTGENAGTWGDKTNTNLNLVQQAIAGVQSINVGASDVTLVMSNAALSNARNMVLTLTGSLAADRQVLIPNGIEKFYIIHDETTRNGFSLTIKTVSGTGFAIESTTGSSDMAACYSDGTNVYEVSLNTLSGSIATAQIDALAVTSAKLASFAVTSARLASYAVTTARLATNAVTAIKITQSTITQSKLAANSVGANQLISTGVTAASYTSASITVDADGRITAASSGAAGAAGYIPRIVASGASGNVTGTWTAQPGTTKIFGYAASGGGGGSKRNSPPAGGPGAVGAFGVFKITSGNYQSIPFQAGTFGTPATAQAQNGGAGGTTQLGNFFTITGGAGGQFNANSAATPAGSITVGSPSFIFNNTPSSLQPTLLYGASNRGNGAGGDDNNPQSPGNAGGQGVLILYESEN
jgi:hypothetical protein